MGGVRFYLGLPEIETRDTHHPRHAAGEVMGIARHDLA
jgi:hypothetical protein